MKCEDLIYLDSEFLSKKYEDEKNKPVMTSLVRDEGLNAGIRVPFASGGAHTKEVKTYKVSVYGMYKKLIKTIEAYPEIQEIDEQMKSKVVKLNGRLHVSLQKITRRSGHVEKVLEEGLAFTLELKNTKVILVTKDEYFSSGYENLLNLLSPIYLSVDANVECVVNIIGWNETLKMAIGVPYVIKNMANKANSADAKSRAAD